MSHVSQNQPHAVKSVVALILAASVAMAAGPATQPNEIPQEQINAAMRRLEKRQKERLNNSPATSQPAGDNTIKWSLDGPYSRRSVTTAKHDALMQVTSDISASVRTGSHTPDHEAEIAKLRKLADVYRSTSIERYRDLLIERDRYQADTTKAAMLKWKQNPDALKGAVERARQALVKQGIVRSSSADYSKAEY